VTFGKVAEAAAKIEPPQDIRLKDPKDWKLAGQPKQRLEIIDKVQGRPIYGIDVRVPDMLYAALVQCPVFRGTLASVDESKAVGIRGVHKVVKMKDAVAVVADTWWQAKKAADALAMTWDEGAHGQVSSATIRDFLRTGLAAEQAGVGRKDGDIAAGLAQAVKRIEAEYDVPFLGHATMEPQNCTARVEGNTVEIWVPTQNAEAALAAAAKAAGVSPRNVVVHRTMLGGGFGRRGAVQDFVPHAVLIAKEMGRPVKTVWSREEDTRHDFYRPVAMAKMTAGLDATGLPVAWHVRMTGNSIRGTLTPQIVSNGVDTHFQEGFLEDMPYDVPNFLADYAMRNTHVPVGFWRSVNQSQNAFFKESFIDELAHVAGVDPYRYRRKLLGRHRHADKHLALLDAVAKKAGWELPLPPGIHRGLALNQANGTFVAAVAEVSVGEGGQVRPRRMIVAINPGHVVNPRTVAQQVEGSVVYGLSAALYGEITIKDGRVEQSNFHDYQMLRLAEMPEVETLIMPTHDFWGGVGEPVVSLVAPALCNAIFAGTGRRIRSLPVKNHDIGKV
jgi:isoquinoline 1-oxidoreductase beta subunit